MSDPFDGAKRNARLASEMLGTSGESIASRVIRELSGSTVQRAMREAQLSQAVLGLGGHKSVAELARQLSEPPTRDLVLRTQRDALDVQRLISGIGGVDELTRRARWAHKLAHQDHINEILGLGSANTAVAKSIAQLSSIANRFLATSNKAVHRDIVEALGGRLTSSVASLQFTTLKMSTFAGATDMLGARSAASQAAFNSLLGQWHSRPGLSKDYWIDSVARRRMYREADVDEGLIEAPSSYG
jgi:hypothetical protein